MRECKLPLRTVLQNFINNVESLESLNSNTEEVYEQEFQELKKLTESLKTHPEYVCTEGEKECNRRKNRYKDILPYDRTRVVLQAFPSVPGSDYINANYIRGASGSRAYIASQGPLPHTVPDFWRMVVECEVQVIIMASNETEGGKHKCECYWVENDGEERQFGNVLVSFIKSRQVCPDFLVRTLKIKFTTENDKTEERTICQFHYMLWPDHGVPDTVRPLLHMVRLVRDCQASETLPVLVHCSAGCGRTGTICAIDYVWGLLRTGKLTDNLCLLDLVREMRVQRVAMVQTKEQYTLLHQAVKELFRERLSLIDSHPYENVATDGNPLSLQSEDKESDYEELFSQEKQDFSSKSVHASATGVMGSLSKVNPNANHKLHHGKDNLRRSASTSSLDTSKIAPVTKKDSAMQASLTSSLDASLLQRDHQKRLPTFQSESMLHYNSSAKGFEDSSPSRRPPRGYSKTEKEAENFAQKMEAKEREMRKLSAPQSHGYHPKSKSNVSSPSHSPSGTTNPAFTPTSPLPSPLVLTPPMPPPRSRTPSPIVSMRKSGEMGSKKMHPSSKGKESSNEKRKSDELARHTSIQKLRELFEKSPMVIECPNGTRLSRSASSVTTRPGLSLHSDATSSLKSKRKISLGSEQFHGQGSKSKDTSNHTKFQICPPPPLAPTSGGVEEKDFQSSPMMVTKPPSSPVLSGTGVKRKVTQSMSTDAKEEKASALLSRLNDRPALPIKKSKSFRWSRSQGGSHPSPNSSTSPELARKKSDLNTYFSLDREKESYPKSPKGEGSIKKIANDFFPLHQDGLKLSVYEVSNSSGKDGRSNTSDDTGDGSKIAMKPQIPPKKSIGVKFNKKSKIFPLDIPHSQSAVQIHEHDASSSLSHISMNSKESQTPLSAPPNSTTSFENQDFWDKMQLACFENLYDELPARTLKYEPPLKKDSSTETPSTSQGSKDYVNARVLSSYLKSEGSPKVSYVPLPSKREFKEKGIAHDYENCSVFSHPDLKSGKPGSGNNLYEDTVAGKNKPSREEVSHQAASNSSDYEPVDFGETLTSVDEVFETLNHELIDKKYENKNNKRHGASSSQDYYLNKDLDSLAIQVYKDCQAYLLHGNSQSPVPSLIVKTPIKEDQSPSSSAKIPIPIPTAGAEGSVADLDEVRNKVSVPPQGLRNRERRNSYRQAVSTVFPSYGKGLERPMGHMKKVHKYEKIWFETMKEETDEEFNQRDNRESVGQDLSSNFNHPMNISGKEAMFKDKLEELHGLVSNMDRKALPDLSEEELSSRDSGSTSSLFSRSAQSSRSSERIEPTYVNALVGPSGVSIPSSGASSKHQYPLIKGTSPYGTLATTTSYPYKPKMVLRENSCGSNGIPTAYATSAAATLPVRSTQSSSPQNIPPPMGFGNPATSSTGAEKSSSDKRSRFPPIFKEPKDGSSSSEERVRRDHRSHSKFPAVSKAKPHSEKETRHSGPPPVENSKERSNSAPERENGSRAHSAHSGTSLPSASLEAVHPQIVNPSLNPSIYYHSPSEPKSFPVPFGLSNFNGVPRNNSKGGGGFPPADPSSTDTEEEAAAPSKSSSNPLLRRLKATTSVKGSTRGAQVAKESSAVSKEERERGKRGAVSPPGSPRSFSKALGKLKLGSRSVAANFKSYLSSRPTPEPSVDSFGDPASRHYPLQKSVSSGPSVSLFTHVGEDSKLPSPEPKKTNRELPQNFRCYDQHNNAEPKASRARQQYL